MRVRESAGSMPIMNASDGSWPGPTPNMTRPIVWWSSCTMRSASMNGLWYGSEDTPVPSRMRFVRSAAAAMNTSGEPIVSQPAE